MTADAAPLLEALRAVVRKASLPAVEAAQAALKAFRASQTEAAPASATCAVCREVDDSSYALSTAANPDSLPPACARLIPPELCHENRCYEEFRCPGCGTGYVYERGYEFLVGGTEDEETLTRLNLPMLLDRVGHQLDFEAKYGSSELQAWLRRLESALRMA
jgi:hypothetical protein